MEERGRGKRNMHSEKNKDERDRQLEAMTEEVSVSNEMCKTFIAADMSYIKVFFTFIRHKVSRIQSAVPVDRYR